MSEGGTYRSALCTRFVAKLAVFLLMGGETYRWPPPGEKKHYELSPDLSREVPGLFLSVFLLAKVLPFHPFLLAKLPVVYRFRGEAYQSSVGGGGDEGSGGDVAVQLLKAHRALASWDGRRGISPYGYPHVFLPPQYDRPYPQTHSCSVPRSIVVRNQSLDRAH